MKSKKSIITISMLLAVLIALILVFALVVLPLLNEDGEELTPPDVMDGEGLWLDYYLTMYPEIDEDDIRRIDVKNEHGEYAFVRTWDIDEGKYKMKLEGLERVTFDAYYYANLMAYTRLTYCVDSEPIRNITDEQLEEYGLTEETASAEFTITFVENGEEKSHTVYIGNMANTEASTYYATVAGRHTAYRMRPGVEECLFLSLEDYLSPMIYQRFRNVTYATLGITDFSIFKRNPDDTLESYLWLVNTSTEETESADYYLTLYKGTPREKHPTIASSEQITRVFEKLFTTGFEGDMVMAVNPDEETLLQYGLSQTQTQNLINARFRPSADNTEGDSVSFFISELMGEYYYALSYYYDRENPFIVRIPKETLSFLEQTDTQTLKWAATNSVYAGFYESLVENDDLAHAGLAEMEIISGELSEKFFITNTPTEDGGILEVTTQSGEHTFRDDQSATEAYTKNQFSNFYMYVVYFPMPYRFNSMTEEELSLHMSEDKEIYKMTVKTNADVLHRYTYYQIDSNYAIICSQRGEVVDGTEVWQDEIVLFDTSMEHLQILMGAYEKLLSGVPIIPSDHIN